MACSQAVSISDELDLPAVVAFAPVGSEGVVQRFAGAGLCLAGLLGGLAVALVAKVVGVRIDAQEPDQAVQLAHTILHQEG